MKVKLKDILVDIKKIDFKENDLLAVTLLDIISESDAKLIAEAITRAIGTTGKSCGLLILSPNSDIVNLDSEFMSKYGWYRIQDNKQNIDDVF